MFWRQVHYSKQGQAFKSRSVSMQIEILQSPWLYELMAFHINLRESKVRSGDGLEGCSLIFDDGKPSLYFEVFDSFKHNIDLSCSICLVSKPKTDSHSMCKNIDIVFLTKIDEVFFLPDVSTRDFLFVFH